MKHLRIGTRGSLLAKWQAESVRKQLFRHRGRGSRNHYYQNCRRQNAAGAADANRREGNFHQGTGRSAAGRVHRPGGAQRERHSDGDAVAPEFSRGLPARRYSRLPDFRNRLDAGEFAAGRARGHQQLAATGAASASAAGPGYSRTARQRGHQAAQGGRRRIRRDRAGQGGTRPAGLESAHLGDFFAGSIYACGRARRDCGRNAAQATTKPRNCWRNWTMRKRETAIIAERALLAKLCRADARFPSGPGRGWNAAKWFWKLA